MESIKEKTNKVSREITDRMFEAIEKLIEMEVLKNQAAFVKEIGVKSSNFSSLRTNDTRFAQFFMCAYLVSKYRIDGNWLLGNVGGMFRSNSLVKDEVLEKTEANKIITERTLKAFQFLESRRLIYSVYDEFLKIGYKKNVYANLKSDTERSATFLMLNYLITKKQVDGNWLLMGIGEILR